MGDGYEGATCAACVRQPSACALVGSNEEEDAIDNPVALTVRSGGQTVTVHLTRDYALAVAANIEYVLRDAAERAVA